MCVEYDSCVWFIIKCRVKCQQGASTPELHVIRLFIFTTPGLQHLAAMLTSFPAFPVFLHCSLVCIQYNKRKRGRTVRPGLPRFTVLWFAFSIINRSGGLYDQAFPVFRCVCALYCSFGVKMLGVFENTHLHQ